MSDFLFAKPTAIDCIMSVIDLFGVSTQYNDSSTGVIADQRAMRADMNAIKTDFMNAYKSEVASYAQT